MSADLSGNQEEGRHSPNMGGTTGLLEGQQREQQGGLKARALYSCESSFGLGKRERSQRLGTQTPLRLMIPTRSRSPKERPSTSSTIPANGPSPFARPSRELELTEILCLQVAGAQGRWHERNRAFKLHAASVVFCTTDERIQSSVGSDLIDLAAPSSTSCSCPLAREWLLPALESLTESQLLTA